MARWTDSAGRVPAWVLDAALALAVLASGLLSTTGIPSGVYQPHDAVSTTLVVLCAAPYLLRRRYPLVVLVLASSALAALMLREHDPGALPFTLLVAAYTVGAERPARVAGAGVGWLVVLLVVLGLLETPLFGPTEAVISGISFVAAVLLGRSMRERGQRIEAFAQEEEQAALRAAADERLRIAREMHDVVAHSLGVIAVQAGVALHVLETDSAQTRTALENISKVSRASLNEVRHLLGVVRTEEEVGFAPAPGLADVERLAEEVSGAGLRVEVVSDGDTDRVPSGVGLAAYRIVQEALTNALRHAGASRATVRLEGSPEVLVVDVTDDGRGPGRPATDGHGLLGMRERVAVYGGSLDVGPVDGRGFRVVARLPYDAGGVP